MNSKFFLGPIQTVTKGILHGDYSPTQAIHDFLENLTNRPNVKSWVQNFEELQRIIPIQGVESLHKGSKEYGPLSGLIVGIKDNIATKEFPTKMGTQFWKGTPGEFDARIVSKLRYLGAIIAGKTACSEFAVHKPTGTLNPRYRDSEPGTSSSGSAAAVANSEASLCLGTQTAGSIVKPASYCGVIGFKPSFGDLPRTGVLKTTELFDTVGFLGRRISDISLVYNLVRISGLDHPVHSRARLLRESTAFDKIILLTGQSIDSPSSHLSESFIKYASSIQDILSIKNLASVDFDFERLRHAFYEVYYRDLAYFIRDHLEAKDVSRELKDILDFGIRLSDNSYLQAKDIILSWQVFMEQMPGNPLILSLATSTSAPKIGVLDMDDANPFITSAGLPQVSIPLLTDEFNKTVGISLSSKRFSDNLLLSVAQTIYPLDAVVDFQSSNL